MWLWERKFDGSLCKEMNLAQIKCAAASPVSALRYQNGELISKYGFMVIESAVHWTAKS